MSIRRRPPNPSVSISTLRYQVNLPDAEPRSFLEKIVWRKEIEVNQLREQTPLPTLQQQVASAPPARDFLGALRQGKTEPALIAEVKKASPSKGVIRADFDPVEIAQSYAAHGASCLSVLTDTTFFQGCFDYLIQIRQIVDLPLLCKEFILYPYQIYLARTKGADAVLLIAAILSDQDLSYFIRIAQALGMTALVETHTEDELARVLKIEAVNLIGINNRNLETFVTNLETTERLLHAYRDQITQRRILTVSESGIHDPRHLERVATAGAQAVLIGESLMKQSDPGQAVQKLFNT